MALPKRLAVGERSGAKIPIASSLGSCLVFVNGAIATYWADIFPAILLLALGMRLAIAPLTTLVLTSIEPDRAGTASGFNSAVSRAGSLIAIAVLGGVLQQGGPQLVGGSQTAMIIAAIASVLATLAVFIIEPGPHVDFVPKD